MHLSKQAWKFDDAETRHGMTEFKLLIIFLL